MNPLVVGKWLTPQKNRESHFFALFCREDPLFYYKHSSDKPLDWNRIDLKSTRNYLKTTKIYLK